MTPVPRSVPRAARPPARAAVSLIFTPAHRSAPANQILARFAHAAMFQAANWKSGPIFIQHTGVSVFINHWPISQVCTQVITTITPLEIGYRLNHSCLVISDSELSQSRGSARGGPRKADFGEALKDYRLAVQLLSRMWAIPILLPLTHLKISDISFRNRIGLLELEFRLIVYF